MYDFYNPPKVVVGERETRTGEVLCQLYSGIDAPLIRTSIRVAEMAKYCDNAFHALKVSFANEIGNLCKKMGVDSHDVMSVFCEDKKLNLSSAYLKPGFAFGGSCLPKDLRALAYQAKRFDLESHVLNAILMSNAAQVRVAIQMIMGLGKKRIGFLGMAFKPGTDDLRESPIVELIETLLGKGPRITRRGERPQLAAGEALPDAAAGRSHSGKRGSVGRRAASGGLLALGPARAQSAGRERTKSYLSSLLVERAEDAVDTAQVVVVGYASAEFVSALKSMRADQLIIDLARIEGRGSFTASYDGICWR